MFPDYAAGGERLFYSLDGKTLMSYPAEFSETKDKNKFLLKTYDVEAGTNTPCINFSIVSNHGKNEFFKGSKAFNGCGAEELFNTDDITITKYAYILKTKN